MPVPGDRGTDRGEDAGNQGRAIAESDDEGDGQWHEPLFQKAGNDQEGNQPENQAAGPDVVGEASTEPEQPAAQQDKIDNDLPGQPASEPASSMRRMNKGSVLPRMCRRLACRNGMAAIPASPCRVRRGLIRELAARGKVVLFSSHELDTVERVSSHIVILHKGRIVANDSIEHLRTLMSLPTLEGIFSQLAVEQNTEAVTQEMMELIES